jgi:hypothetical protein
LQHKGNEQIVDTHMLEVDNHGYNKKRSSRPLFYLKNDF